jgi:hypothetical protein
MTADDGAAGAVVDGAFDCGWLAAENVVGTTTGNRVVEVEITTEDEEKTELGRDRVE